MTQVGLMLYSARRACAEDFEATLRAVAAMGYDGVEAFDLHGHGVARCAAGWTQLRASMPAGSTRRSTRSRPTSTSLGGDRTRARNRPARRRAG